MCGLMSGWGKIEIKDQLSPAEAETGAELGKRLRSKRVEPFILEFDFMIRYIKVFLTGNSRRRKNRPGPYLSKVAEFLGT